MLVQAMWYLDAGCLDHGTADEVMLVMGLPGIGYLGLASIKC